MAHTMTISVENPSMLRTLRSLFKSMDGVSILPQAKKQKVTKQKETAAIADGEEEYIEPTKEEILAGIDSAFKELKLHLEGKLELKTLEEVLDEL